MQKLKLHPDLGGDNWNASLLNIAYQTLRHPQRREVYDRELLQQYHMKDLSRGHIGRGNDGPAIKSVRNNPGNQRNYYRILHIQSDSPTAIVHSSYRTLFDKKKNGLPRRLLEEAHAVLGNPLKRSLYDRLLHQYSHADAVDMMHRTFAEETSGTSKDKQDRAIKLASGQKKNADGKSASVHSLFQTYSPVITHYCAFCKTPHQYSKAQLADVQCSECQSPLAPPSESFTNLPRREMNRMAQAGRVSLWLDWPDNPVEAELLDISPTGLRAQHAHRTSTGQMVKIDAGSFKAVGEVSHSQQNGTTFLSGIRFIAVQFEKQRGQFIQTSI